MLKHLLFLCFVDLILPVTSIELYIVIGPDKWTNFMLITFSEYVCFCQ